jgi:hypothetical protein
MLSLFEAAGFVVEMAEIQRWDGLPTQRKKLAIPFRNMPEDELNIKEYIVCLRVPDSKRD